MTTVVQLCAQQRIRWSLGVGAILLAMGPHHLHAVQPTRDMARIPAGTYQPLYSNIADAPVIVAPFLIDRAPITRRDYLQFVRVQPAWQKDQVNALFANPDHYLQDWPDNVTAGAGTDLSRPVTNVSWFAARSYCESLGKRLPTLVEWEYVAAASATKRYAARDERFIAHLLQQYALRSVPAAVVNATDANIFGVRGLHSSVWEWVDDFNSIMVSDDSRGVGARDVGQYCASAAIGAVDPSNFPAFLRSAFRAGLRGDTSLPLLGFRCAL